MANIIKMKNPSTGQTVEGFYGYSWTTLLFGAFPSLFRSDFLTFIGVFAICILFTLLTGVGGFVVTFIWSFMYNKYYTLNLIKKGFKFNSTHEENKEAALNMGIELTENNCMTFKDTNNG